MFLLVETGVEREYPRERLILRGGHAKRHALAALNRH
jgi:hypothetical protein